MTPTCSSCSHYHTDPKFGVGMCAILKGPFNRYTAANHPACDSFKQNNAPHIQTNSAVPSVPKMR